jgi:hypothetical protein
MRDLFDYLGQERDARQVLINDKLAKVEDVALMTSEEVSMMICEHYEVVSKEDEQIILMKKEDMDKFRKMAIYLNR